MENMIQEFAERIPEMVQEHWLKVLGALAVTLLTSLWGIASAWRRWRSRHDEGLLHISQNTIKNKPTGKDGANQRWLILDVHTENKLTADIENPIARWYIKQACKHTTATQPFLLFPENERWYVLDAIRMKIAEQFVHGTAAKMSEKAEVDEVECVFAVTYERYPGMRRGKLRVMLIRKDVLEDPHAFDGEFRFESKSHADRLITLCAMQEDYLKGEKSLYCMDVRINIQL